MTWLWKTLAGILFPPRIDARGPGKILAWGFHIFLLIGLLIGLRRLAWHLDLHKALAPAGTGLQDIWLPLVFFLMYVLAWLVIWWYRVLTRPLPAELLAVNRAWAEGCQALQQANLDLGRLPLFLVLGNSNDRALLAASGIRFQVQGVPERADAPVQFHGNSHALFLACGGLSGSDEDGDIRLRYLCRLIARARRPGRPINGVLLLLNEAAASSDPEAARIASHCRRLLLLLRRMLQVDCPVHFLLSDLDKIPGFRTLTERLVGESMPRSLACRFPLFPDLDYKEIPLMWENGVNWLFQIRLRQSIYSAMAIFPQTEGAGPVRGSEQDAGRVLDGNASLYRFLSLMRERGRRLGQLLAQAARLDDGSLAMVRGFFLAGGPGETGKEAPFLSWAFRELIKNQDNACWTSQALEEERTGRRLVRFSLAGLCLLILGFFGRSWWARF